MALVAKDRIEADQKKDDFALRAQKEKRESDQFKISLQDRQDARSDKKNEGSREGVKALDKDFAKDYNDWTSTGKSSLNKNLSYLEEARQALKDDPSLTGGGTGILGDRLTADRVLAQRQKVNSAIQGSLKATLGGSFTQAEGERVLKNAYNEAASPETNMASLDATIRDLRAQALAKESKSRYFEKNNSLNGYQADSSPMGSQSTSPMANISSPQSVAGPIKTFKTNEIKWK